MNVKSDHDKRGQDRGEKVPRGRSRAQTIAPLGNELAGQGWSSGNERLELNLHIMRQLKRVNPEFVWNHYCGFLIISGEGTFTDENGRLYPLRPGAFGQHLPGKWHRIERTDVKGWCEYSISMNPVLFGHFISLGGIDANRYVHYAERLPGWTGNFLRLHGQLRNAGSENMPRLTHEVLALLLQVRYAASHNSHTENRDSADNLIAAAREYLAGESVTPGGLIRLAAKLGMSYSHFRRRFREITGQSPGQYRLSQRMSQARALLAERRHLVREVADAVGYADSFIFSKQFKKFFGVSPTAFARPM
jgi:AraC-like DNA-binding protein/mannose-6-phosphate isomerase-like protein (cupin superfamily)